MRIGGAVFVGIALIAGAFYISRLQNQTPDSDGLTANSIESTRGILAGGNWEEELREMSLRANPDAAELDFNEAAPVLAEPTTLTEKFSRSFFESYVRTNASGRLENGGQEAFLNASIDSLAAEAGDELYTSRDITIGGSEIADLRAYGNAIAAIVKTHLPTPQGELTIFQTALANDDGEELKKLANIHEAYDAILTDTLHLAAPSSLAVEHVALVNAYLAVRNDIRAMETAFEDPLYALVRVKRYQDDELAIIASVTRIYRFLYQAGVRYASDEPGSEGNQYIK